MALSRNCKKSSFMTNPRKLTRVYSVALIFDTGSGTIGVESSDLIQCKNQPGDPCRYGTYNNLSSSTAELVQTSGYYDGTGNMRSGNFISDVVAFGGRSFDNITFGQVEYEDYGENTFPTYQGLFGKYIILVKSVLVHKYSPLYLHRCQWSL
jgi:hypothetical protein